MFLQPKSRTFKKDRKNFIKKNYQGKAILAKRYKLSFGAYGLKALASSALKASQIESVRRVLVRYLRKIGHIWIRIFPSKPISGKPLKTRMGKGKGSVQFWAAPVKPGQILFEINGAISKEFAQNILKQASHKLPIATKFVAYDSISTSRS